MYQDHGELCLESMHWNSHVHHTQTKQGKSKCGMWKSHPQNLKSWSNTYIDSVFTVPNFDIVEECGFI